MLMLSEGAPFFPNLIRFEFAIALSSVSSSRPSLLPKHAFHFPQPAGKPRKASAKMPEERLPRTPNLRHNLTQAITICETLQQSLLCTACKSPYSNERPWRSRNCDHTFCANCAAAARGHGELNVSRGGRCPVDGCDLPLRPADVVEDVGVRGVLDACRGLMSWAADAANRDTANENGVRAKDVFDGDVRLGSGLVASQ